MAGSIIQKTVVFYELVPTLFDDSNGQNSQTALLKLFEKVKDNINKKSQSAFVKHGGGDYLIDVCTIDADSKKVIKGVIRCFTDESPELFNRKNYNTRDIEKAEDENIAFSTHFVIRVIDDKVDLAIESNRKGPNYQNLIYYLEVFGKKLRLIDSITPIPHTRDSLEEIKEKFGRCSEFLVKIHKEKIPVLKKVDENLHGIMEKIKESYEQEYATMILKYDYKDRNETNKIWQTIINIRKYLLHDSDNKFTFEKLEAKGEEKTKNLKLELFDLLSDKLKVLVPAEKRENSEAILYPNFLTNIAIALNETILSE